MQATTTIAAKLVENNSRAPAASSSRPISRQIAHGRERRHERDRDGHTRQGIRARPSGGHERARRARGQRDTQVQEAGLGAGVQGRRQREQVRDHQ